MKENRVLSWLAAIGTATLATACTVGPDYRPPAIDTPADWTEAAGVANQDPANATRLAQWWTGFADPTLDRLVGLAIEGNHDVRIAGQRIAEARADRVTATAAGLPSLSFSATAERTRQSTALPLVPIGGISNTFFPGFDASWEIDLFGKTRRSVEAADATVDATVWDRRAVLVSLLGELGADYASLRTAQERIAIA
jgi:outer membrane protein TolC